MGEHTPKPWSVYGSGGGAITGGTNVMGDLVDLIVVAADGFPVAELPLTAILPEYSERTGHWHWADAPGEAYIEREVEVVCANAHLIAAAPDLLAEGQRALAALDSIAAMISYIVSQSRGAAMTASIENGPQVRALDTTELADIIQHIGLLARGVDEPRGPGLGAGMPSLRAAIAKARGEVSA